MTTIKPEALESMQEYDNQFTFNTCQCCGNETEGEYCQKCLNESREHDKS